MATLNWDHSMINVQNLDHVIKVFADKGVVFKHGGKHEVWGTANALGYFGINYIELISVFDREKSKSFDRPDAASVYDAVQDFNNHVERLNTVAIRSDDLNGTWQRLKDAGIPVGRIFEGQRLDEQSHLIKWQIFFIDGHIEGLPYPFFIDWQSKDEDRISQLKEQELIQEHPAGNLKVVKATFEVEKPKEVAQQWAQLIESSAIEQAGRFVVPIQERKFEFTQGKANHLIKLDFSGADNELKNQTITIGDSELDFE